MKGFRLLGDYALEIFVVTLLLALSALLILPFIPMFIGVVGYFKNDINTRRFKDIFTSIGSNWKIILKYTLFELVIVIFPVLNIYFFNTHPESMNYFVLAVSYIALIVGGFYFITAPVVIINMQVNFRQLLYNGIMLLFGGLWRTLLAVAAVAAVVALILYFPYVIIATLYLLPLLFSKLMTENFYRLKAKALNISVSELKRRLKEDDYLNEDGEIDRPEQENMETNNEES